MKEVSPVVMAVYEFWNRLWSLEGKYGDKACSPVRRRLDRIFDWSRHLLIGRQPMDSVPLWLYNELMHVEEGGGVGRCPGGIPNETPLLADLMYHGVLGDWPWWEGNKVLPSTLVFGKTKMKNEK